MLCVFPRTGSMDLAAVYPMWSPCGSLACPTGTFLLPRFFTTPGDFTAGFGFMRSQASICHLLLVCLVHQIYVYRCFKDLCRQFDRFDLFTLHVENVYFHSTFAPII